MEASPDHRCRLLRFLSVGMLNTGVGLGVIFATKAWVGLGDIPANMLGYATGLALSFPLNKRWTFGYSGRGLPTLGRFLSVFALAYAVNLATVLLLVGAMNVGSYVAQAVAVAPYTLVFYIGSRHYAFATKWH